MPQSNAQATSEKSSGGPDFALLTYFALWYLGNYYYNITNKLALKAAGGAAGFPMIISTLQLGVGERPLRASFSPSHCMPPLLRR